MASNSIGRISMINKRKMMVLYNHRPAMVDVKYEQRKISTGKEKTHLMND
jgi:hypothetical protein